MRSTARWTVLLLAAAPVGLSACGEGDAKPAAATAPVEIRTGPPEVWLLGHEAARRISAIKVVREITSLGLKASKDLVEGPPRLVKVAADQAEAEVLAQRLRDVGVTVEIRPGAPLGAEAARRDLETAVKEMESVAALVARPLTDADVEHYVAIVTESSKGGDKASLERFIVARGLTASKWTFLQIRIKSALIALRGGDPAPFQTKPADVEFLTKHRARLEPLPDLDVR